ncbi:MULTISPECIES: hypothetical protein [unclassified Desulfovibrio]|uniref:helix-turn-helix domain-containing transcriptional regulator n=1 Tax=unclassified Desulfovibrio TaxID=2593640 RepID=UPI0013E9F336|nr:MULTISPECIES: hypothetical protein [unclassified Desulfovibrio]
MDNDLLKVSKFDAADYLKNEADVHEYLDGVRNENEPRAFLKAINTLVRAKGMVNISKETGIPKEGP